KAKQIFPRVSFDLIYGLPGETESAWEKTLETALTLASEHLSAYQLMIEPGTEFHRRRIPAAEPELGTRLFEMTREKLADAGLPAYEISNHASGGAECRHNLVYWRGEDYLGIGPGAHGRISNHADDSSEIATTLAVREPSAWLSAVEETGSGVHKRQRLSLSERRDELFLMGLRLSEGVSAYRFREKTGFSIEESVDPKALASLTGEHYLIADTTGLRATEAGFLRLDAVLAHLLAGAPDMDVSR
ncbi:MAG: coproporphyrinogen III oxidase, partial [Pseudomonadota bacterium]|nr:coproporphyrinogen III oxidase [Pseudomonadota bacterium]